VTRTEDGSAGAALEVLVGCGDAVAVTIGFAELFVDVALT
jgi:hypothetical protein